jgi:hypothetical protein
MIWERAHLQRYCRSVLPGASTATTPHGKTATPTLKTTSANTQDVGPGLLTKEAWCGIGERYATAGPIGGDFIAGCVQGLTDAGVYGN